MDTHFVYEIIGYIASVLIAVSLMMTAIIKLRVINLIGAATFSLYGVLIGSIPVAAMNGFIVLINIYFLYQIFTSKEYFKLLQVSPDSKYLNYFIDFYKDDISKTQPNFTYQPSKDIMAVFVLRDMVPAGLVLGKRTNDGVLNIELDYVISKYRDFKIAHYLYHTKIDFFRRKGVCCIKSGPGKPIHNKYLEKVGFKREADLYVLDMN